jgi:bacterial/archaeal transporter family protein
MWIYLGITSSLFLGFYDVSKKHALKDNAVLAVLFLSTLSGALWMLPEIAISSLAPGLAVHLGLYVPILGWRDHVHFFAKAFIVATSWIFAYFGFKHLPISIVSPIRASGPVWTLLGAVILFREMPNRLQWIGLFLIIFSYAVFSLIGRREGIRFHRDKWVFYIFLSTLIGTCSSLYDKYLIQRRGYSPMAVQAWYFVYLVLILGIVFMIFWWPVRSRHTPFQWRWTVAAIGFFLMVSDFVYFRALEDPRALIVLLSAIRRSNVVFSFFIGSLVFRDVNIPHKSLALAGVLAGVLCIVLSVS